MAEVVHEDVIEQILIRLDVKDLIRYKSVCKSWHSLITSPRFVNRHLNHSYSRDHCNNKLRHRRIILERYDYVGGYHIVGSCNGLVCISSFGSKVMVVNPLTREARKLEPPPRINVLSCWGFGYDSSTDDYKVIVGGRGGFKRTCVQVFSLKSNAWSVTGDVEYTFVTKVGILCNDALHWIVNDQKKKKLILSYDISKEEFKEIPQPDDANYDNTYIRYLGIIKDCLCIPCPYHVSPFYRVWFMKNYNVKQSWELTSSSHEIMQCRRESKYEVIHVLRSPKHTSFFYNDECFICTNKEHHGPFWTKHNIDAPVYVQSLVSPHANGRPKPSAKLI